MRLNKLSILIFLAAAGWQGASTSLATDIDGVQSLAFDQPQVNGLVQPLAGGQPYGFNDDFFDIHTFNIAGYLDTGASGVVISQFTAGLFAVPTSPGVTYTDVAVGGTTDFAVSVPLTVRVAASNNLNVDNPATFQTVYDQAFTPVRTQVGPAMTDVPDEELSEPLDVFGMPVMIGKTVVMDPKPVNNPNIDIFNLNPMNTYIYNPNTPFDAAHADTNPGIPTTSHHVQLSYGDFSRFTATTGGSPPTLAHNPFIGPNPVAQLDQNPPADNTPPVSLDFQGHHAQGSFLLDTGAAVSFISSQMASLLHVRYATSPVDANHPLELFDPANPGAPGTALPGAQFTLPLQGLGGQVNVAGFYLDDLILHTLEGSALDGNSNNLKYLHAPVFIQDIKLEDPITHQQMTLDGVFGMNFMMPSGLLTITDTGGPIPDIDIVAANTGPYNWITFDEPNGILGLDLIGVPEPGSVVMAAMGVLVLAGYAWRRRLRS